MIDFNIGTGPYHCSLFKKFPFNKIQYNISESFVDMHQLCFLVHKFKILLYKIMCRQLPLCLNGRCATETFFLFLVFRKKIINFPIRTGPLSFGNSEEKLYTKEDFQ